MGLAAIVPLLSESTTPKADSEDSNTPVIHALIEFR